jgi:phosphatidylserine/phosphatidylglycerophosphate/cardiolipin synthase-like enzyme
MGYSEHKFTLSLLSTTFRSVIGAPLWGGVALALLICLTVCPVMATEPLSPPATVADAPLLKFEIGFSPKGKSLNIILDRINQAEKSIQVAAYSFTSKPISTVLLDAQRRGVAVQVATDAKSNTGKYSAVTFLANQGVPVRVNSRYAIFHHKFMIFDERHLETGSFNYSAAAVNKNAENVLVLMNVPEIAKVYTQEWRGLWGEGGEVQAPVLIF